jgi:hypothetical protein
MLLTLKKLDLKKPQSHNTTVRRTATITTTTREREREREREKVI